MNTHRIRREAAAGFSLIELLVSMVIALVVTLAITSVLVRSEGSKRSTTSVNDVSQTGTYLAYTMDRTIRSAGSGFAQNWEDALGCVIDASKAGAAILPLPQALDPPFANLPSLRLRLAPVLIGKGLADTGGQVRGDVLSVMSGTSGGGDTPQVVSSSTAGTPGTVRLTNTLGYADNDIVLLADSTIDTGRPGCMLQQVATGGYSAGQLTFTGADYARDNGSVFGLNAFVLATSPVAIQMGSVPANPTAPANPPQMLLYGVGDNSTLFSYDLLRAAGNTRAPTPLADGVVEMRALYGIDTTIGTGGGPDGSLDTWVDPGDNAAGYTYARLTQGDNVAQGRLRRIVAIRVGLILRTSLQERDPIPAATTLTLFGDARNAAGASLAQTRTLSGNDLYYRFRTVEFTIPLRNVLYAPSTLRDGTYPPAL